MNDPHDNAETDAVMMARQQQIELQNKQHIQRRQASQQPKSASRRSIKYMQDLARQKQHEEQVRAMPQAWRDLFIATMADTSTEDPSTMFAQLDTSKFIDMLKKCPFKGAPEVDITNAALKTMGLNPLPHVQQQELTDGIYQKPNGTIYRIYWNLAHTRLLAKTLIIVNPGDRETGIKATVKWQYAGAATRFVQPDEKMPYNEAKSFGELYGMCIYGHPLNDPVSIHLGIGPVCGERQFGGEFKFMVDQAKLDVKAKKAGQPLPEEMTKEELQARLAELNKELGE